MPWLNPYPWWIYIQNQLKLLVSRLESIHLPSLWQYWPGFVVTGFKRYCFELVLQYAAMVWSPLEENFRSVKGMERLDQREKYKLVISQGRNFYHNTNKNNEAWNQEANYNYVFIYINLPFLQISFKFQLPYKTINIRYFFPKLTMFLFLKFNNL